MKQKAILQSDSVALYDGRQVCGSKETRKLVGNKSFEFLFRILRFVTAPWGIVNMPHITARFKFALSL